MISSGFRVRGSGSEFWVTGRWILVAGYWVLGAGSLGRNVEPNCIRLGRDLPGSEGPGRVCEGIKVKTEIEFKEGRNPSDRLSRSDGCRGG